MSCEMRSREAVSTLQQLDESVQPLGVARHVKWCRCVERGFCTEEVELEIAPEFCQLPKDTHILHAKI